MQNSGFFNSKVTNGVYDRTYNANDYSDNLAVVISNGVLRSINDDLKVSAAGMVVSVGAGRAWINGHYYINDAIYTFSPTPASVNGSRYDRIMLRFNNDIAERNIKLVYVQGIADESPTPPAPTRAGNIYDLVLADVFVGANASSVVITDKRGDASVCGWVYSTSGDNSFFTSLDNTFLAWFNDKKDFLSSVTLFKRYTWETSLQAAGNKVQFEIPQYRADTCFIEVYVNGIFDTGYTLYNDVITFDGNLIAGTKITVNCYKSIDGTGIMSVAEEITVLQNQMAAVQGNAKYVYNCTGVNDNISLSQIAQAFYNGSYTSANVTETAAAFLESLGGNAFLAAIGSEGQFEIDVVGNFAATSAYNGSGTNAAPFRWLVLGTDAGSNIRLIFNFSKCNKINILCAANTENNIIYGADLNIRSLNIKAFATADGVNIKLIDSANNKGRIYFENCRMKIDTTGSALLANHGTFTNCWGYVMSKASTAYCFKPLSAGLLRINSGEYYAYGLTASGIGSAIFHTSASETDGTVIANNLHCPVVTLTNYSQGFLSVANAGTTIINTVVSRLTSSGDYNTITGLINKNKA